MQATPALLHVLLSPVDQQTATECPQIPGPQQNGYLVTSVGELIRVRADWPPESRSVFLVKAETGCQAMSVENGSEK